MSGKNILVTGAGGFIGKALCSSLIRHGWNVTAVIRSESRIGAVPLPGDEGYDSHTGNVKFVKIKDIAEYTKWDETLAGIDVVVHLAGIAHVALSGPNGGTLDEVNAEGTRKAAEAASRAGVKRFIFISTIKVHGDATFGTAFTEDSPLNPEDDYARSKVKAEEALREISRESGMEFVILRPTLVYGRGVKGNMESLVKFAAASPVIPSFQPENERSLVYLGNLISAIEACATSSSAANGVFIVSDAESVSTAKLLRVISEAIGRTHATLPVPRWALSLGGAAAGVFESISGKAASLNARGISKLTGSLKADGSRLTRVTGWRPEPALERGIKETVEKIYRPSPASALILIILLGLSSASWILANLAQYQYFLAAGGWAGVALELPTVLFSTLATLMWTGFHRNFFQPLNRKYATALFQVCALSLLIASAFFAMIHRFEGVSRTELFLFPVYLFISSVVARWMAGFSETGRISSLSKNSAEAAADDERGEAQTQRKPSMLSRSSTIVEAVPNSAGTIVPSSAIHDSGAPAVSVVIVNFNAGRILTECVKSVLASSISVEVIVSDNDSTDGSVQYLRMQQGSDKRLRIIENRHNLGFAAGNNIVLPYASSDFVLFLNPDCIIEPDTLERMIAITNSYKNVGMAGCLIKNLDGTEQAGCRRSVPTPWRSFIRVTGLSKLFPGHPLFQCFDMNTTPLPQNPVFIEAVSGAFMLVRKQALESVGPLDEKYFMHCEDLDWCMRFRRAGWNILFAPQVEITHAKGACSHDRPVRILWYKHKGMVRFYRKFFHNTYPLPLMALVVIGVWMRFAALVTLRLFLKRQEF